MRYIIFSVSVTLYVGSASTTLFQRKLLLSLGIFKGFFRGFLL